MFYWFAYYFIKVVSFFFFPFRVEGRENIPVRGACLFAGNHLSNLDPVLIGLASYRKISYMAKDNLFKGKVFGWMMRHVNAFPINRETADVRSVREAVKRLRAGSPLVVFPEGTRAALRMDSAAKQGVGFLAVKSGVPIIPVLISGSDKVLPPRSKWFKSRHPITVVFGPAFHVDPSSDYSKIADEIMQKVYKLA